MRKLSIFKNCFAIFIFALVVMIIPLSISFSKAHAENANPYVPANGSVAVQVFSDIPTCKDPYSEDYQSNIVGDSTTTTVILDRYINKTGKTNINDDSTRALSAYVRMNATNRSTSNQTAYKIYTNNTTTAISDTYNWTATITSVEHSSYSDAGNSYVNTHTGTSTRA